MDQPSNQELHFDSCDQALAKATELITRQLEGGAVSTTGNFSLPQIVEHLARSIDIGLGQIDVPKVPWLVRIVAKMMKKRFLNQGMKPGFKLPSSTQDIFWPESEVDPQLALSHYAESLSKLSTVPEPISHPYFGEMTREEQVILHCRHAELHFGFVIADG